MQRKKCWSIDFIQHIDNYLVDNYYKTNYAVFVDDAH